MTARKGNALAPITMEIVTEVKITVHDYSKEAVTYKCDQIMTEYFANGWIIRGKLSGPWRLDKNRWQKELVFMSNNFDPTDA